jgi:hypothetical protein
MLNGLKPIDFSDTPEVFDAGTTPIPSSIASPIQIVSALAKACFQLDCDSTINAYIGVYVGAPGLEVLETILAATQNEPADVLIPKGARVSLRAMEPVQIDQGTITVKFMGVP